MDNSPAIISYKAQLGKIKAQIKQMTTYPTQHLIELAYAAYRINKGYIKQTRRYSEGQPTTFSNKEMITFTAHSDWKPEDFVPLKVTDADRAAKVAGDKHMRRYTMLAMGNLPDFEADLFAAYSSSEMQLGE